MKNLLFGVWKFFERRAGEPPLSPPPSASPPSRSRPIIETDLLFLKSLDGRDWIDNLHCLHLQHTYTFFAGLILSFLTLQDTDQRTLRWLQDQLLQSFKAVTEEAA